MSSRFNLIAQQLLHKDFGHCTIDELQQYAAAHPYLASAQFLLAKKVEQEGDSRYQQVAQKAALYYHQPVAFSAFLLAPEPLEVIAPELPIQEPVYGPVPVAALPEEQENAAEAMVKEDVAAETIDVKETPVMPILPKLDAPINNDALTFEPFHTVDYFASMGIRLSQEEVPKDKFGKQLMSFTAWLKTMKKLPASEQAKNMDPQAEAKVENMAAHSVSAPEVVTETMAEIWLRQGQPAKAADVYRKLSLLHPSKKAYFAHKLENLKQ